MYIVGTVHRQLDYATPNLFPDIFLFFVSQTTIMILSLSLSLSYLIDTACNIMFRRRIGAS